MQCSAGPHRLSRLGRQLGQLVSEGRGWGGAVSAGRGSCAAFELRLLVDGLFPCSTFGSIRLACDDLHCISKPTAERCLWLCSDILDDYRRPCSFTTPSEYPSTFRYRHRQTKFPRWYGWQPSHQGRLHLWFGCCLLAVLLTVWQSAQNSAGIQTLLDVRPL